MSDTSPWYDLTARVPRRDQVVRVVMKTGVDHQARFIVQHTEDWPSGAWWELSNGRATFPFGEVAGWSPDPNAQLPKHHAEPAEPTDEPEAPASTKPSTPAILIETLKEIERTGVVLRLLPPDHYDWSPHPDIASIRTLALRLVRIVARIGWILELDSLELSFEPDLPELIDADEIVATYQANETTVREAIPPLDGTYLQASWQLERNGEVIAKMPRGDALRRFGVMPIVYHRGEAAVMMTALGLKAPHPYPEWAFKEASPDWSGPA